MNYTPFGAIGVFASMIGILALIRHLQRRRKEPMHPLGRYCPACGQPTDKLYCPIDNSTTIADTRQQDYIPMRWQEIEHNLNMNFTRPVALVLITLEDMNGVRLSATPRVQTNKQPNAKTTEQLQDEVGRRLDWMRWMVKEGHITEEVE